MLDPISIVIPVPIHIVNAASAQALATGRNVTVILVEAMERALGTPPTAPAAPVSYDSDVERAVERCMALPVGTLFSLNADFAGSRRLFSREEWQALAAQASFSPTVFGRHFSKAVKAGMLATPHKKTDDNKQLYERLITNSKENL